MFIGFIYLVIWNKSAWPFSMPEIKIHMKIWTNTPHKHTCSLLNCNFSTHFSFLSKSIPHYNGRRIKHCLHIRKNRKNNETWDFKTFGKETGRESNLWKQPAKCNVWNRKEQVKETILPITCWRTGSTVGSTDLWNQWSGMGGKGQERRKFCVQTGPPVTSLWM